LVICILTTPEHKQALLSLATTCYCVKLSITINQSLPLYWNITSTEIVTNQVQYCLITAPFKTSSPKVSGLSASTGSMIGAIAYFDLPDPSGIALN
jgi:hypothetical protein